MTDVIILPTTTSTVWKAKVFFSMYLLCKTVKNKKMEGVCQGHRPDLIRHSPNTKLRIQVKPVKKKKTLNSHINAVNWVVLHRFLAEYLSNIFNGSIKALR